MALFALAAAIEKRVELAAARAGNLPQAILFKAFAGELVPTEADLARKEGRGYESAEQILARVRREQASLTQRHVLLGSQHGEAQERPPSNGRQNGALA